MLAKGLVLPVRRLDQYGEATGKTATLFPRCFLPDDCDPSAAAGRKASDHNLENATTFEELPRSVKEKTERRWKKMTDVERQKLKDEVKGVAQVPTLFLAVLAFIGSFRLLDILWFGFASYTAFRVSRSA